MSQNIHFFKTNYVEDKPELKQTIKTTLDSSLNNILAAVHSQIKYNPKPSVPKVPKPIADTMAPSVYLTASKSGTKTKNQNLSARNIPQLQADIDSYKHRIPSRHTKTSNNMSFQNQQRYLEVLRQKRILENMLQEHQKLQSDRDNIANEINYMRSYLDGIRNRLDVSLRKLNTQRTVSNQSCFQKKSRPAPKPQVKKNYTACVAKRSSTTNGGGITNRSNVKTPRIGGGGYAGQQSTQRKVVSSGRHVPSVSGKRTITVNASGAGNSAKKQWVYCSRIDRKNEIARLH